MRTQVKLSAIVVGMHSAAKALLEALPLVHHGDADRGLGRLLRARLLQALALCHAGVHHAAVSEVQALALHKVLQESVRISEAYSATQRCPQGQGECAESAMGKLSSYPAYYVTSSSDKSDRLPTLASAVSAMMYSAGLACTATTVLVIRE